MRLKGEIKRNQRPVNNEQVYELLVTKVTGMDEEASSDTAIKTPTVLEQHFAKTLRNCDFKTYGRQALMQYLV